MDDVQMAALRNFVGSKVKRMVAPHRRRARQISGLKACLPPEELGGPSLGRSSTSQPVPRSYHAEQLRKTG
jgi:hypothetical protein